MLLVPCTQTQERLGHPAAVCGWVLMSRLLKKLFWTMVAIPFVALFLGMILGPPVFFVMETVDLFKMRGTAVGTVENVRIDRRRSTSRAVIHYSFDVGQQRYVSERYLPGFAGNQGGWTGGAAHAEEFPVGRKVTVYYDPHSPDRCALEYGWFKWTIGFWLGLWSMLLRPAACDFTKRSSNKSKLLWCAANATLIYGIALIIAGPNAVRVRELGWHLLAWIAAFFVSLLVLLKKSRFNKNAEAYPIKEKQRKSLPSA